MQTPADKRAKTKWRNSDLGRQWKRDHKMEELDKSKRCRRKSRAAAMQKLGNKCANPACQWLNADGSRGCTDSRCLQIDHVLGGGSAERKKGLIGHSLNNDVIKDTTGKYQALCANCNWIKKYTNHENSFD